MFWLGIFWIRTHISLPTFKHFCFPDQEPESKFQHWSQWLQLKIHEKWSGSDSKVLPPCKLCTVAARILDPESISAPAPTPARGEIRRPALWIRPREKVQAPAALALASHPLCQEISMAIIKIKEGCPALIRSSNGQSGHCSARDV